MALRRLPAQLSPLLANLLQGRARRTCFLRHTNFDYRRALLPGARVIACERDPRDIGLSIFTYRFYGVHAYANDLADLGWYIGQQRRLMAHWRNVLPNPIMTVRLQDLAEHGPVGQPIEALVDLVKGNGSSA